MSFLFRLCLGFLLLTPVATRASVLEIPGTGSNLSGIDRDDDPRGRCLARTVARQ